MLELGYQVGQDIKINCKKKPGISSRLYRHDIFFLIGKNSIYFRDKSVSHFLNSIFDDLISSSETPSPLSFLMLLFPS
jgi:hypothetical protein